MVYEGIIYGLTVRMRSIEEKDAEISYKMRTDPAKNRFLHKTHGGVEHQRQYIAKERLDPTDYYFVIEDLDGKPIGLKGLYEYDPEKKTVVSGRFIGYGSQVQNMEALMLGFDFAFDVLGVETVTMDALENNTCMLSIQKKFGVEFTHRFREEGMEFDSVCSVLTKEAYAKTRPGIEGLIKRFADREVGSFSGG